MDSILFSSSEKLVSGSQLGLRSNSFLDKWFKNYIAHIIESHFSVSSATHDFAAFVSLLFLGSNNCFHGIDTVWFQEKKHS